MKRFLICLMLVVAMGSFKTGCVQDAKAENIMLTQTSSFTIVTPLVVTDVTPAEGSSGVSRTAPITMNVLHVLPIVSASLGVMADGVPIAGALGINNITGGKHLIWTPAEEYPMFAVITWVLNCEVDNGL